jgi:hypothetical protein
VTRRKFVLFVVLPVSLLLAFTTVQTVEDGGPFSLGSKKSTTTSTTTTAVPVVTSSPEPPDTVQAPVSTPVSDHTVKNGFAVIPRHDLTPGATDDRVTQSSIADTICSDDWVAENMPPPGYMTPTKTKQIAAYGYSTYTIEDFALDHLVPLELGGDPTALANLWPEPWEAKAGKLVPKGWGAETKNALEAYLHAAVCNGRMSLTDAQTAISGDWIAVANDHDIAAGEQAR